MLAGGLLFINPLVAGKALTELETALVVEAGGLDELFPQPAHSSMAIADTTVIK